MASFAKRGHGRNLTGTPGSSAYKTSNPGSSEGKISEHPHTKGYHVLRHKGFTDVWSHNRGELDDRLAARRKMGWKNDSEERRARLPSEGSHEMKKFSDFLK